MGRQHRDAKLDRVYFDPERVGSYGGVDALHRATGEVPKRTAKRWLSEQDAYALHKPVRRRFKRRRVVVGGQNQQWQDDLVDVANLKKIQRRYKVPVDGNRRFFETGMVRSVKE